MTTVEQEKEKEKQEYQARQLDAAGRLPATCCPR
jgi:hypothetical protein